MAFTQEERHLSDLFRDLLDEVKFLFQQEIQLFKVEMTRKASEAGKDVALIAMGGAVAYAGLLVILAAVTLVLAMFIPAWVSAFIVGLLVIATGYALIQKGINHLKHIQAVPQHTIASLKETKQWTTNVIR
ncbi:MAG TPA: phage holin family protein [Nitrospirales bacterium]|nr:phage holin family protein [Nitrospiraceae bacterium]HNP27801.1 phage holin family protein [Nitrospirales bacterium]